MARKTKEQELDMFNDEKNSKKAKSKIKKKNVDKIKEENDKFSFDNEIVIGVTRKEEPKRQVAKKKSNNRNNKKNNTKKSNNKKIYNAKYKN